MADRNLTDEDVQALATAINTPPRSPNQVVGDQLRRQAGGTITGKKTARFAARLSENLKGHVRSSRDDGPEMRIDEEAEAKSPTLRAARERAERARAEREAEQAPNARALAEANAERDAARAAREAAQAERDAARIERKQAAARTA
jgi:hypothetical protein